MFSVNQFVNMSDQQLHQLAEYQTAFETGDRKVSNNAVLLGVPLIDSFARSTFKQGGAGEKASTFAKGLLGWTGVIALASIYNTAYDGLKKNVPAFKKFDENHPNISTALNFVGFWVALDYAYKGAKKVSDAIVKKFPDKVEKLKTKQQSIVSKIDNSWANSKLYKPAMQGLKYMENNFPQITKGLKYALPWVAPLLLISGVTKSVCAINAIKNRTKENYENLKILQKDMQDGF